MKTIFVFVLFMLSALLFSACGNNDSEYDSAVKSECRPLILPPLMALVEEGVTTTDDTLLSDDDAEPTYYEPKVTLISREAHHLVFMYTTAVQCGDDIVFSTKTELDDDDPTTILLRLKSVDTDPHVATPCSCVSDFTVTVDDAEHDLLLVKRVTVLSKYEGGDRTFEF